MRGRTSTSGGTELRKGRKAPTEHCEREAEHLRGGPDPEEGRRPPQSERAGRRHPHREPQRQSLPNAHHRATHASIAAWNLGGRCIGIGSGRAAPGPRRNAAGRGGGAKAEAGETRWGGRSLEAPVGSKEDTTGDGYRGGRSRRRGAEEKHAEGRRAGKEPNGR